MGRGSFIFVVIVLITFTTSSGQRLGVYPSTLDFRLDKGQAATQVVHLFNGSNRSLQFRLYLNDWLRDSLGAHAYYQPDTLPQSLSRWLTLDSTLIAVGPGKTADINVTLRLPDSADAAEEMKWSMLFLEQLEDHPDTSYRSSHAEVTGLLRWGVHIYQTPPAAAAKRIRVSQLSFDADGYAIRLVSENVGEEMVSSSFYIELEPMTGRKKIKLAPREYPLFPGQRRMMSYALPKGLKKGYYTIRLAKKAGSELELDTVPTTVYIR